MTKKTRGLGRGLNALFDDDEDIVDAISEGDAPVSSGGQSSHQRLGVEQLAPGHMQPRLDFEPEALEQLADSIRAHGILQPLLVRQKRDQVTGEKEDGQYEIIAGERRWRAAQKAQLHDVPVIIRDFDDAQAMQIALIENLQREDLNPVEESLGYQRLMDEHEFTQVQLAELLGRSRSHIANMVRMLNLSEPVLELVRSGDISTGHARCLIPLQNQMGFAEKIMAEGMSVRETERHIANISGKQGHSKSPSGGVKIKPAPAPKDADTVALENQLGQELGMRLSIESANPHKGGHIRIDFKTLEQLNELLEVLQKGARSGGQDDIPTAGGPRLVD